MSHPVHWTFDADNDQWVRDDGVVVRVGTIPSDRDLSVPVWEVDFPWAWVENRTFTAGPLLVALLRVDEDYPMPSWLMRVRYAKPGWEVQ